MQKGFTLIELLVVVLIIGILAAVALPQYQKAVLKSRFSSLVPTGKSLNEGNEAYYLEHGSYANSVGSLDVTTNNHNAQVTMGNEDGHKYVKLTRSDIQNNLMMYQKHSPNFPGETHCEALINNSLANWLCEEGLSGTFVGNKYGYSIYSLSPQTVGTLARNYYDVSQKGTYEGGDTCTTTQGGASKCSNSAYSNESACKAYGGSNHCRNNTYDNSTCEARASTSCNGSTYTNASVCTGGRYSCGTSTYSDHSHCTGTSNACSNSNFSGYSYCEATESKLGCSGNTFTDHSICYPKVKGACQNGTYDSTSYCDGAYCPSGSPSPTQGKCWDGKGNIDSTYCSAD